MNLPFSKYNGCLSLVLIVVGSMHGFVANTPSIIDRITVVCNKYQKADVDHRTLESLIGDKSGPQEKLLLSQCRALVVELNHIRKLLLETDDPLRRDRLDPISRSISVLQEVYLSEQFANHWRELNPKLFAHIKEIFAKYDSLHYFRVYNEVCSLAAYRIGNRLLVIIDVSGGIVHFIGQYQQGMNVFSCDVGVIDIAYRFGAYGSTNNLCYLQFGVADYSSRLDKDWNKSGCRAFIVHMDNDSKAISK